MTMPASGTISMSQINTELGRSSTAQISLNTAEDGGYATINTNSSSRPSSSNPASMSEWYSYNHNASAPGYTLYWDHNHSVENSNLRIYLNGTSYVDSILYWGNWSEQGSLTVAAGVHVEAYTDAQCGFYDPAVQVDLYNGIGQYQTMTAYPDAHAYISFYMPSSNVNINSDAFIPY